MSENNKLEHQLARLKRELAEARENILAAAEKRATQAKAALERERAARLAAELEAGRLDVELQQERAMRKHAETARREAISQRDQERAARREAEDSVEGLRQTLKCMETRERQLVMERDEASNLSINRAPQLRQAQARIAELEGALRNLMADVRRWNSSDSMPDMGGKPVPQRFPQLEVHVKRADRALAADGGGECPICAPGGPGAVASCPHKPTQPGACDVCSLPLAGHDHWKDLCERRWADRLAADSVAAGEAEYGRPHTQPEEGGGERNAHHFARRAAGRDKPTQPDEGGDANEEPRGGLHENGGVGSEADESPPPCALHGERCDITIAQLHVEVERLTAERDEALKKLADLRDWADKHDTNALREGQAAIARLRAFVKAFDAYVQLMTAVIMLQAREALGES